ncbi:MAG: hypothetical protein IPN69_16765 [Acidobacteria bacterium]|nr:hypothetical protein [Acidobacteriota bacterium]
MRKLTTFVLVLGIFAISALAQASNIVPSTLSQSEIDRIVKKFSDNEFEFRQALGIYAFNRDAKIQTIGLGGQITGTYIRNSFITFTTDGSRFERIIYAPISTLKEISISPEDIEDLGGINPFAIEPKNVREYNFRFVGKEKIDELDLYVFDVTPKVIPDWKKSNLRLFTGRIWVDDRDLMIVKSKGKAVPEGKQRFPIIETWRESVDGKYWFPSFSMADDELVFDNGQVVKMRVRVKYANYRVGRSEVRILDDTEEEVKDPKPTPTPAVKKP